VARCPCTRPRLPAVAAVAAGGLLCSTWRCQWEARRYSPHSLEAGRVAPGDQGTSCAPRPAGRGEQIRRLRGFQEGVGAQGGLRLPQHNRAGSELDLCWGRQARTSPAWPPLGTRMCTVLRLIAGVDALRLRSGLVSNAAQEEVGFIA
jgi:hypothetical protein